MKQGSLLQINTKPKQQKLSKLNTKTPQKLSKKSPIFTPLTQISTSTSPVDKIFSFQTPSSPTSDDDRKVYLSGIPHDLQKSRIKHILQNLFGKIEEVKIIKHDTPHPLRYGFVTFRHLENVKKCLEFEVIDIDGHNIYARKFKRKQNKIQMNKKRRKIEEVEESEKKEKVIGGDILDIELWLGERRKNTTEVLGVVEEKKIEVPSLGNGKEVIQEIMKTSERIELFGRHNPENLRFRKFTYLTSETEVFENELEEEEQENYGDDFGIELTLKNLFSYELNVEEN